MTLKLPSRLQRVCRRKALPPRLEPSVPKDRRAQRNKQTHQKLQQQLVLNQMMPQVRPQKPDQPIPDKRPRSQTLHPKRRKLEQPIRLINRNMLFRLSTILCIRTCTISTPRHLSGLPGDILKVPNPELILKVFRQVPSMNGDIRLVRLGILDLGPTPDNNTLATTSSKPGRLPFAGTERNGTKLTQAPYPSTSLPSRKPSTASARSFSQYQTPASQTPFPSRYTARPCTRYWTFSLATHAR